MRYYYKMLVILWKLPIKLRYHDIEVLAEHVQQLRVTEKELVDYIDHLESYIDIEDVVE